MLKHFTNSFLDKLCNQLEPHQAAKELRTFGANLSQNEMAKLIGVSPGTIRRYESASNPARIPLWYFGLLRFLSGDLSFYGSLWRDSTISTFDQKLRTYTDKYSGYTPMDLQAKTNFIYQSTKAELDVKRLELDRALRQVEALKQDNKLLQVQIERLEAALSNRRLVRDNASRGNIIEFKR